MSDNSAEPLAMTMVYDHGMANKIDAALTPRHVQLTIDFTPPSISSPNFHLEAEVAWKNSESLAIQVELAKGMILSAIACKDMEQGTLTLKNWLKKYEVSEKQANAYIDAVEQAGVILDFGLKPENIRDFTYKAFRETLSAPIEVQSMIVDGVVNYGGSVTQSSAKQISEQFTVSRSELFSDATKKAVEPKYLAPILKEAEKIPKDFMSEEVLVEALSGVASIDDAKASKSLVRAWARYAYAMEHLAAIKSMPAAQMMLALQEAFRLEMGEEVAALLNVCCSLQDVTANLWTKMTRVQKLQDAVLDGQSASSPHLAELLQRIEKEFSSDFVVTSITEEMKVKFTVEVK